MNQYTQLLYYLKSLADADEFVNTVTQGDPDKIDWDKGNIFPLVHIVIDSGSFTNGQTIVFNVSLAALQQRDVNNEVISDKFWKQDNEVDNHNEMLAVLNRMWLTMYRDFSENNITASENPELNKITYAHQNTLDGWELNFEVELPNTTINLCPEE